MRRGSSPRRDATKGESNVYYSNVESVQGINEPRHQKLKHPKTGKLEPVVRLISGAAVKFEGAGWTPKYHK